MGNSTSLLTDSGKRIVWSWQSNSKDPWEVPEDQREWTPYTNQQAIIIEKAYLDQREVADLGGYCVLIPSMIQYQKGETNRQRRVLRQVIDEKFRQDRFSDEPSKPKCVNVPLGARNDFTKFLMAINNQCKAFEALELDVGIEDRKKLQKIMSQGISKEGKILGATTEARELSKQIEEVLQDTSIFRQLMQMYTQETFLYKRVNTLLKEENWRELDNLAPYIFYLVKAFEAKTLAPKPEDLKAWSYLYRAMALDQEALSFYDPSKTKYFSWFAFTSTSRNPAVVEMFKSAAPVIGKIQVLFTFDISECCPSQLANISKVSDFKNEQEVIIAPTTQYEIISKELKDDKCYIRAKVLPLNDIQVEQEDPILDAKRTKNLQELKAKVMRKSDDFEISNQNDRDIKNVISILSNGQEVKTLVIRDSVFQKFGLIELCEMLQKKDLRSLSFINVTINPLTASLLPKNSFENLRHLHIEGATLKHNTLAKLLSSISGKNLRALSFHSLRLASEGMNSLVSLASSANIMSLEFTGCEFPIKDLEQTLARMQIQHLQFDCKTQGNDILGGLSRVLPYMKTLKQLDFKADDHIEDDTYQEFLQCLPQTNLASLTLDGDIDEDRALLLADAVSKSNIARLCVSSPHTCEENLLEILSRSQMKCSVSG